MRSLLRLVFLVLLLAGWGLAAASLHAVRLPHATCPLLLIPRASLATSLDELRETYVDARNWTMADVSKHPAVVTRMLHVGKGQYLFHVADPRSGMSLEAQLADAVERSRLRTDGDEQERTYLAQAEPQTFARRAMAQAELGPAVGKLRKRAQR